MHSNRFLLAAACLAAAVATAVSADDQVKPAPLPHVRVDAANKTIDLDAKVVLREGDWIELLGCAPNTREHESIVTIAARPSHVHTALLLIGLEPGSPIQWKWINDDPHIIPPHGSRVAVWFVTRDGDGKEVEVPANQWIKNKARGATLPDNVWLFTGSKMLENDGRSFYQADIEGNIISVVNFGDEVLGLPTQVTDKNDKGNLTVNSPKVPKVGTPLVVRLRAAKPVKRYAATIAVDRNGAHAVNDKRVAADQLTAVLKPLVEKVKQADRLVLLRVHPDAPVQAYRPALEAIVGAQTEFVHEVGKKGE
jgi:biopolymer transport protein ExbD